MNWMTVTLALIGSVIYVVVIFQLLRYALIGIGKIYRWVCPTPQKTDSKFIDLEQGSGWRYLPDRREAFLGPSAKAFAILFGAGLLIYPTIRMVLDEAFYWRIRAVIDAILP